MTDERKRFIGYWMSQKKSQKLNWVQFSNVCRNHGYELVKVDLERSLDEQGPFMLFLHKLTDIIALANQGDKKSQETVNKIELWIEKNPQMAILDPFANVRRVLDRYLSYSAIDESDLLQHNVFTPTFAEIKTQNPNEIMAALRKSNVSYPFVCKPSVSHGSKRAHQMCIIFSEESLGDCTPPCVAQSFVNHNAILYKLYIVGEKYYVVERPSLKNFYPSDRQTIFFDSHDVSKADSQSTLSILDPEDLSIVSVKPDPAELDRIVSVVRRAVGMSLIGVDVIIENHTGKYAIIDINAYPSYDGFPNFFESLMVCIKDTINTSSVTANNLTNGMYKSKSTSFDLDQDSGIDTGDSSDERAKFKTLACQLAELALPADAAL